MYEPSFSCSENLSHGISWCSGECRWDQTAERDRYSSHEGKLINILIAYLVRCYNKLVY